MNDFDLRKYLAENKLLKEADNFMDATEDDPFYPKEVGRKTGVRLNMRKILRLLKDQGYPHSIARGNSLFPTEILAGGKDEEVDLGAITITKNGEIFGDDMWGIDIHSEEEVIPAIELFVQDQKDNNNN